MLGAPKEGGGGGGEVHRGERVPKWSRRGVERVRLAGKRYRERRKESVNRQGGGGASERDGAGKRRGKQGNREGGRRGGGERVVSWPTVGRGGSGPGSGPGNPPKLRIT